MKQTISVLVENRAGILSRVTSLFARRAFNIDSLAVGVTDDPTISRITILVDDEVSDIEQVTSQLNKLVEVIKIRILEQTAIISRELMIIKVEATPATRQEIMTACDIMGAKVEDVTPTTMTLVITSTTEHLDIFQEILRPFNILEVSRTGAAAVQKGSGYLR